jgi:hypothetical protein
MEPHQPEAPAKRFYLNVLGGARNAIKKDYILRRILFVTSDIADVNELGDITRKVSLRSTPWTRSSAK